MTFLISAVALIRDYYRPESYMSFHFFPGVLRDKLIFVAVFEKSDYFEDFWEIE